MTGHYPTRRAFLAGAVTLVAAACASDPPRIYTLARVPGTPRPTGAKVIAVRSIGIPQYLDRPQLVRYGGAYEFQVAEFERWGEPFGDMIERLLVANLGQRLPDSRVYLESTDLSRQPDMILEVDITRFEGDQDGNVTLAAQSVIRPRTSRRPPAIEDSRITTAAQSPSTSDMVAAMSQALGDFTDELAAALA